MAHAHRRSRVDASSRAHTLFSSWPGQSYDGLYGVYGSAVMRDSLVGCQPWWKWPILTRWVAVYLERLKWFLWHGKVYRALQVVQAIEMDLDVAVATGDNTARKLLKAVEEFHTYIARNQAFIPNYGEHYRYGERISTGCVESTVNQVISKRFCKKQQMQWTKRGAHLLLQTQAKTLNQELGAVFPR